MVRKTTFGIDGTVKTTNFGNTGLGDINTELGADIETLCGRLSQ